MLSKVFTTTIENEDMIEEILQSPSMKLEKTSEDSPLMLENTMYIHLKRDRNEIIEGDSVGLSFNDRFLQLGNDRYEIVFGEETELNLYNVIRNADIEWTAIE